MGEFMAKLTYLERLRLYFYKKKHPNYVEIARIDEKVYFVNLDSIKIPNYLKSSVFFKATEEK